MTISTASSPTSITNSDLKNHATLNQPDHAASISSISSIDGKVYGVKSINSKQVSGETVPYRSYIVGPSGPLVERYDPSISTVYEIWNDSCSKNLSVSFLGWRSVHNGEVGPYEFLTYKQVDEKITNISSGLLNLGIKEKQCIGIYSVNKPEWTMSDLACIRSNIISVPLYDTLGNASIVYICNHTEMDTIIATANKALTILSLRDELTHLKRIIIMDSYGPTLSEAAKHPTRPIELFLLSEIEEQGKNHSKPANPPKPSDVLTISYTSGTAGTPKGVIVTHANFVAALSAIEALNKDEKFLGVNSGDRHISYLPLAHILERVVVYFIIVLGCTVGFYQGDPLKLLDDVLAFKPTLFVGVPRVYNRIYDKIQDGIKSKGIISRFLFNMAFNSKLRNFRRTGKLNHWFWDKLVFSSIRSRLGGDLKVFFSGSAPMNPVVIDFIRICFSVPFLEGYGQTEIAAAGTTSLHDDIWPGSVGGPFPCTEVKLVDVPELNYLSTDQPFPRGEVCFRGANVMSGYYKDPERTAETIDDDGWLHSGDIGKIDEMGRIHLIDRKKSIFKLSQGEYVAPERIEIIMNRFPLIEQSFVHGYSIKSYIVGIVVPNKEAFLSWSNDNGFNTDNYNDLCKMPQVKKKFLEELTRFCKTLLKGFEMPKSIYLEPEPFSVANDLMTSTFKLKRQSAISKYSSIIDRLYSGTD